MVTSLGETVCAFCLPPSLLPLPMQNPSFCFMKYCLLCLGRLFSPPRRGRMTWAFPSTPNVWTHYLVQERTTVETRSTRTIFSIEMNAGDWRSVSFLSRAIVVKGYSSLVIPVPFFANKGNKICLSIYKSTQGKTELRDGGREYPFTPILFNYMEVMKFHLGLDFHQLQLKK